MALKEEHLQNAASVEPGHSASTSEVEGFLQQAQRIKEGQQPCRYGWDQSEAFFNSLKNWRWSTQKTVKLKDVCIAVGRQRGSSQSYMWQDAQAFKTSMGPDLQSGVCAVI